MVRGSSFSTSALDGPAFAGGVRPLEDHHERAPSGDELALEGEELELVMAELLLVLLIVTDCGLIQAVKEAAGFVEGQRAR